MKALPTGWTATTLRAVADWSSGGTPSRKRAEFFGGDIPWVKTGELTEKYVRKTEEMLTELGVKHSSAKIFPKGSVGIAMYGATIGKVSIWGIDASTNQACAVARPIDGVASSEFLYHFLRSEKGALVREGKGGAQPNISQGLLKAWPIALPPINEQNRIVEKIEALFDEIDRGVQSLRDAQRAIALYRQSLLKSAFEGRLTADWRAENSDKLESPDALLQRICEERKTRYRAALEDWERTVTQWRVDGEKGKRPAKPKPLRRLPADQIEHGVPGWATVPLGLAVVDPIYGTSKKCGYGAGATGVLRIPNIKTGHIDTTDLKSADFDETEVARFSLQGGDVLTVRSNGSLSIVGKPAMVQQQHTDYLFAGYLIRLRPIAQSLIPKYLVYLLMEPKVRAQIETKAKSTSGVNNISARELQELNVPICSPEEQAEIVRILDTSLEATEIVDAEIEANLARAEALRQSILKKAFSGQLVPQDPNDEPAATLPQRMRADNAPHKRKRGITEESGATRGLVRRALREAAGNVDV